MVVQKSHCVKKFIHGITCATFFLLVFFSTKNVQAQTTDTIAFNAPDTVKTQLDETNRDLSKNSKHLDDMPNPKKATLYALIPGGGQIYNWAHHDKWWAASLKLTVIYGGFGILTWQIVENTSYFRDFRDAYKWVSTDGVLGRQNEYTSGQYNADQLKSYMDYYQTNMEWCYLFTGILYALQIVEATVTAHLLTFDVSDNLSFGIAPLQTHITPQPRLQNFCFKVSYHIGYK